MTIKSGSASHVSETVERVLRDVVDPELGIDAGWRATVGAVRPVVAGLAN